MDVCVSECVWVSVRVKKGEREREREKDDEVWEKASLLLRPPGVFLNCRRFSFNVFVFIFCRNKSF